MAIKPFTDYLNQGMQNTNKEAGSINMPPNPINTPPMNNNLFDVPQPPVQQPIEQPKPPSMLDSMTMNNKITRNTLGTSPNLTPTSGEGEGPGWEFGYDEGWEGYK